MTLGLTLSTLFFLYLLFSYQRQEKIYIGYTTVLSLLFTGCLLISLFSNLLFNKSGTTTMVVLLFLILGSLLIYITSQLTLAFQKIQALSQHIAIMELEQQKNKQDMS
jgi:general stress protein CsbA